MPPSDATTRSFHATYLDEKNQTIDVSLSQPENIRDSFGNSVSALALTFDPGSGRHWTYWLDSGSNIVRSDVACAGRFEDRCIRDAVRWDQRGFADPLCLRYRDAPLGTTTEEVVVLGKRVAVHVDVTETGDHRVFRVRADPDKFTLAPYECAYRAGEPVPDWYTSDGQRFDRTSFTVSAALRPPDDPRIREDKTSTADGKWFAGDDQDIFGLGISPRQIIGQMGSSDATVSTVLDDGCVSMFNIRPLPTGEMVLPGTKLAEGELVVTAAGGTRSHWMFSVHERIGGDEVRWSETDPDPYPDCHGAAPAGIRIDEAVAQADKVVQSGSLGSYWYRVERRPPFHGPEMAIHPYLISTFRPAYTEGWSGSFSYTPYQMRIDLTDGEWVSAQTSADDIRRLDP